LNTTTRIKIENQWNLSGHLRTFSEFLESKEGEEEIACMDRGDYHLLIANWLNYIRRDQVLLAGGMY